MARTLAFEIQLVDAMLGLFNENKIRAFNKDGQPDNSFFQICAQFLNDMLDEDGTLNPFKADLDKLDELESYVIVSADIPTDQVLQNLNTGRVGHLQVIK